MPQEVKIAPGTIHEIPADLIKTLQTDEKLLEKWNTLTPLARNEWICWVTIVKRAETREHHINLLKAEIVEGKKRPCCWPGCPHHRPSAKKWFENLKEEK